MVNSPLIRPYLLGVALGGGTLGSHDLSKTAYSGGITFDTLM